MITVDTFGAEVNFVSEEWNKSYMEYGDVSTERKKFDSARKDLKVLRLGRKTGKTGVSL